MTSLAAAVMQAPNAAHGIPTGDGWWRFAVQAWLPGFDAARVGSATVGTSVIDGDLRWVDMTQFVQGFESFRGTTGFGDSPNVGTATIRMASKNHQLAPWMRSSQSWGGYGWDFKPGLLMRAVVFRPGSWRPLFTGEVERWVGRFGQDGAEPHVEVNLIDTIGARLAGVYHQAVNAVNVPYGNTQAPGLGGSYLLGTVGRQFGEILYEAKWPYGSTLYNTGNAQSTLFSLSNSGKGSLELAREIAAGARLSFHADVYGRIRTHKLRPIYKGTDEAPPQTPLTLRNNDLEDGFEVATDVQAIVNRATFTNDLPDGGVDMYVAQDETSMSRYGTQEVVQDFPRFGVNNVNQATDFIREIVAQRSNLIDRIDEITLTGRREDLKRMVELGSPFDVVGTPRSSPRTVNATGFVRSIEHMIVPRLGSIHWATRFGLDTYALSTSPAPVPVAPPTPEVVTFGGEAVTFEGRTVTYR